MYQSSFSKYLVNKRKQQFYTIHLVTAFNLARKVVGLGCRLVPHSQEKVVITKTKQKSNLIRHQEMSIGW